MTQREVELPILHKYGSFQELEKHTAKMKAPWVTLHHTDNDLIFGLVNKIGNVATKVVGQFHCDGHTLWTLKSAL